MKKIDKIILQSLLLGFAGLVYSQVGIADEHAHDHSAEHLHNVQIHVDHQHGKITSKPVFKNTFKSHKKINQVVPKALIPEAPILNIEQAMKSFQLPNDFELEVIAAEPLVFDPVIALYDAKGRLWVVEMTTYMPDIESHGEMEHESQIVVLTDTNNDGKMDKRQVILEKLLLPRTLAFVDQGFLWADHTTLYFTETNEENGKIKVIKTEVIDKKYATGGSVEHKPNGMLFSLDNWYYNAYMPKRYRAYPLNMEGPKSSEEVYRNKYWKMVKQDSEFRGQWGITQDDYGRHYFNGNSSPIRTTSFLPNVANRNAKHQFPVDLLEQDVGTPDVYPIRVTPGLYAGDQKGTYNDYKQARHTSACGTLIYRGNQFPKKFYGIGLVSEPTGNLIKATLITDVDGVVSGKNLFNKQSILASTDERFRPVNAVNSPDGTITVVDFYHGIIQHGKFMTPYLYDQIKQRELERHKHIGRIYRIKSKQKSVNNIRDLSTLSNQKLVAMLGHDNGWHRDITVRYREA